MPDPPYQTPATQYDGLLIGGLGQLQWSWPWDLFSGGLDLLLDWMFPVTPGWVQPAYDAITGFLDKIGSWFTSNRGTSYEYENEAAFRADFELATLYAEAETGISRAEILEMLAAGPGEPE
jgi:hypothetical protein